MNEAEARAYGLIAQAIAQHAFAMAEAQTKHPLSRFEDSFPEARRPIYDHYSDSTFEAVAHDLWRLGVFKPLDQQGGWAFHFAFDCDVSDANVVAERNCPNGPTLSELLVTFINLFGDYGTKYWGFSTKPRIAFGQNSRIEPALSALSSIGYLASTDDGYVWTELIAPVMRLSHMYEDWSERA